MRFRVAPAGQALSDEALNRARNSAVSIMLSQRTTSSSVEWNGFMRSVSVVVGSEDGRHAFERNRDVLAPEFAEAVEAAIERRKAQEVR